VLAFVVEHEATVAQECVCGLTNTVT